MGRVLFADAGAAEVEVKSRVPKIVAVVVGITLLVGGSLFARRAGWLDVEEHRDPVDISDLNGPRDVVPALLSGMPPTAPEDSPVLPTILCRVLLDTRGTVYEVRVFQPRSGLDAFEEAAIAAVKQYRFSPASVKASPCQSGSFGRSISSAHFSTNRASVLREAPTIFGWMTSWIASPRIGALSAS